MASWPVRGSKAECSSASRAFFIRQPKWNFGSQAGAAGSSGASPWASAKRRSCGRHWPGESVTSSSASAVRPFTG